MPASGASENPHAGGNAVVLDIGGDVGALVVRMPRSMLGVEVQLEPSAPAGPPDPRDGRGHGHGHGHSHGSVHHPHKAVVDRPLPSGGTAPSLVFEQVTQGRYLLRVLPDGPVGPTTDVAGGAVTEVGWSASEGAL